MRSIERRYELAGINTSNCNYAIFRTHLGSSRGERKAARSGCQYRQRISRLKDVSCSRVSRNWETDSARASADVFKIRHICTIATPPHCLRICQDPPREHKELSRSVQEATRILRAELARRPYYYYSGGCSTPLPLRRSTKSPTSRADRNWRDKR